MQDTQNRPLKIFFADDDRDDRYFFKKALSEVPASTNLTIAIDGEQMMDYLIKNTHNLPDIIFTDINMPRLNGFECLIEIKANKELKNIPVIIYSTSVKEDFADALYSNGAHYYLGKSNYTELSHFLYWIIQVLAKNPARPSRDKFIISSHILI